MARELDSVVTWINNMMRAELIAKIAVRRRETLIPILNVWYFYRPLRAVARWRKAMMEWNDEQTLRGNMSESQRTKTNREFALDFLHAVDTDGDGGLSLCELKAAELGKAGSDNPRFAKASIWLLNDRNFQKYDVRGVGIIEEEELIVAMEVFLTDGWKYDGVFW